MACRLCRERSEAMLFRGIPVCKECYKVLEGIENGDESQLEWINQPEILEKMSDEVKQLLSDLPYEEKPVKVLDEDVREKYNKIFEEVQKELEADKPVFELEGVRGRSIKIYEDKVEITTDVTIGSLITNNATDGTKMIYFKDVVGVQFKRSGLLIGYLQFETANSTQNNSDSNFFNENSFTFDIDNEFMHNIYLYVINQMNKIKGKVNEL